MPKIRLAKTRAAYDDPLAAPTGPAKLFVYGTLRPSLYTARATSLGLRLLGRAVLYGHYTMVNLGHYPALINDVQPSDHPDAGAAIAGELVEADNLGWCDQYEGYPGLYTRSQVEVVLDDGQRVLAWVYTFARPNDIIRAYPAVTTGDWADVVAARH